MATITLNSDLLTLNMQNCVCVCVCVRARARVCVCVCGVLPKEIPYRYSVLQFLTPLRVGIL